MVAIGLLKGNLVADDYEDKVANDPRVDQLRDKMVVAEDKRYSEEYHHPDKRSIANAMQIFFKDGSSTDKIEIEYPIGHKNRREEGIPVLIEKFKSNLATRFPSRQAEMIFGLCMDEAELSATPVNEFLDLMIIW